MPIEYTVSQDGMFVYAKATKILTTEQVLELNRAMKKDKRINPGYHMIFDEILISESHIDIQGFEQIAEEVCSNQKFVGSKLAIVVAKGESFERARYYEKLSIPERQTVIVFNDLSIARKWIGVSKDETE